MTAPRRPRSFGLRTLFVAVAVLCTGLALWESSVIRRCARMMTWVESHGGMVETYQPPAPIQPTPITLQGSDGYQIELELHMGQQIIVKERHIPRWREKLGDVPISRVWLPVGSTQSDLDRARSLFTEADVDTYVPCGGFF